MATLAIGGRRVASVRRVMAIPTRRFVQSDTRNTTTASTPPSTGGTGASGDEPPKYKPGFFSRNPGVVLGGIVLGISAYVYRSSRGKKNFEATQLPIADAAVISPYEAWELRSSNEITYVVDGFGRMK